MNKKSSMLCTVLATILVAPALAGTSTASVSPAVALERLRAGNERFAAGKAKRPHADLARIQSSDKGQAPFAIVLTCADSRLSPELIFDQGIGDIFVSRVAGNTPSPEIIGSIEYAVAVLGARTIVVMGHDKCGAVDAAIKGGELPGSIGEVTKPIEAAVKATEGKANRLHETILQNVRDSVRTLRKESSIVSDLESKGELRIVGANYELRTGKAKMFKVG